jgi:hypothetical protein
MSAPAKAVLASRCWICGQPADTAEHRFKATDIRRAIRLSQRQPAYLQINLQATNKEIDSAKAKALQYSKSLCGYCNNTRTQPYDRAWERLSEYIRTNWREIRRRRSLDLAVPFPGAVESGTWTCPGHGEICIAGRRSIGQKRTKSPCQTHRARASADRR